MTNVKVPTANGPAIVAPSSTEQVLGIRFFNGSAREAVEAMRISRGLLVAPSGTCFERFLEDESYREAILSADLVLPDSGLMVLLWNRLKGGRLKRISGLAYLKALLRNSQFDIRNVFWVLPNERSRDKLLRWSTASGMGVTTER